MLDPHGPDLPEALRQFRPDLLARRGEELVQAARDDRVGLKHTSQLQLGGSTNTVAKPTRLSVAEAPAILAARPPKPKTLHIGNLPVANNEITIRLQTIPVSTINLTRV